MIVYLLKDLEMREKKRQKLARAASDKRGWPPEGRDHGQREETGPKKARKEKKKGAGKGDEAGGGGG